MTNLASLLLLLVSISLLTTQAHCAQDAPGLFYLVLALSSMGYLYLATLLLLWFVVLFCLNGLVIVLELFGVGSRVMQWEGATQDMLDEVPIIKFTKHDLNSASPVQDREEGSPSSSDEKSTAMPSIVVSDDSAGVQSGRQDSSGIVVIDMRQTSRVEESNPVSLTTNLPDTEENIGNMLTFDHLSSEERELAVRISTSCSICLCDYEDLEELRHLPCDHYFHKECVDEWLKLKRTCPLCKYDISRTNRGAKRWSRRSNRHQTSGSDGARGSRRFSLRR
ncbi:hypothetical protein BC939DRAFT_12639 [Gamsiella multidivaricata]|uniref:uncharacterized protein n=1 Tax=Gamsiella multidivaricata TaxID=101098 RepID=UPI0022204BDE|nr:uncharacterized protein BC939DRAFT_12639 [Gamsiella multidivaricata]KAI7829602.1 hypothetical protein BC939DRAFT_12639 [Gamsiella multidivaricata]